MTTIYVLLENDQIRFIGKTRKTDLKEKLVQHMNEATSDPEKFELIGDLFKNGKSPEIKSVFTYKDEEADYYEKLFISDYKFFSGLKLNNHDYYKPELFLKKIQKLKENEIENK